MDKKQRYDHRVIEPKWQKIWEEKRLFSPNIASATKPFYNLMMFPYPSAEGLHVGNMYAFTGADLYGRFKRMQRNTVFEPIGLDGFGIHSENYALKVNRNPKQQAQITAKNFYRQLRATGNTYDWTRTLETYDPDYYRWTQWLFVQMFKCGLAYKGEADVNWCPSCKTVLADEQVITGVCERCKTQVVQKKLSQWFFRIASGKRPDGSRYPDALLNNLDHIEWVEKVKVGQRNWIGRKEGINIRYKIKPSVISRQLSAKEDIYIECFTTRPDTNFGATFIVLGPEHPFVDKILKGDIAPSVIPTKRQRVEGSSDSVSLDPSTPLRFAQDDKLLREIKHYVEKAKKKTQEERIAEGAKKTGVFTGFYAINDLNGKELPIWISDFVLGNVGKGAVVGVPGHDKRDFQFAQTFELPIIRVVVGPDGDTSSITQEEQVQEEEGMMVKSDFLNGLDIYEATKRIMDYLEEKGWGKRVVHYHLRDWLISRQRFWGAPIPMVYCKRCAEKGLGWHSNNKSVGVDLVSTRGRAQGPPLRLSMMAGWFPVPEEDLPVLLPDVKDWKPTGTGKAPLASVPEFVDTTCPNCGSKAERETDVCDTFLDSSWYFLRYPTVGVDLVSTRGRAQGPPLPWDPEITKKWLPVNIYIGGAEHTVLHLLYARFVTMALKDMGCIDFEEPFTRFYAHGLIIKEGAKMSKSRGNVVVPDEYIAAYGVDALRTYLMFLGPFDQGGDFRDTGILGMHRFVVRVWRLVSEWLESGSWNLEAGKENGFNLQSSQQDSLERRMHKTIKEVTEDMENLRYNTAIAHIMEYVNAMSNVNPPAGGQMSKAPRKVIETLLLLLAPFMPHMTEELWQKLESGSWNLEAGNLKIDKLNIQHPTSSQASSFNLQASIHFHSWPTYDPKMIEEDEVDVVVQVNGKLRETIRITNQESKIKEKIEETAKKTEKVQRYLEGKSVLKVIFVPGKLINFVTQEEPQF